jgi:hypothetical protein
MSQHDFNIANQGFPATRADLNNALQALASNSSGDAEPATPYANQWWYETDTNTLKLRNEANNAWLSFATVDQTTGAVSLLYNGSAKIVPTSTGVDVIGAIVAQGASLNKIALTPNASGTGVFTIASPATNTDRTLTLPDEAGTVLTSASTANFPAGSVLQVQHAVLTTFYSNITNIPIDDSLPQITEGGEILTLSITPKSATSKLLIDCCFSVTTSDATSIAGIFLFKNSDVNALAGAWSRTVATNNPLSPMSFKHYMTSGTTSAITFKVRGGGVGSAPTFQINGGSGTRYLGGALASTITITEVGV